MVTTLITGIRSLKIPGPGAVAHMSLHLNQQCQRATDKSSGQPVIPVLIRGTRCPSMLATERHRSWLAPRREPAYMATV
jgi:hypothetical protein